MVLSSACQDVIRAMIFMSEQPGMTQVKNITKELDLPYHFLSKNMQIVSKVGLVDAKRGIDGGVKLAKNPDDIKIIDIIKAVDGDKYFDKCLLGMGDCDCENECSLHEEWAKRRGELIEIFSAMSLGDISKDIKAHKIKRI